MCQKIVINFYISPVINVKTVLPTIVVSTLLINLIEQIIIFKQLKSYSKISDCSVTTNVGVKMLLY